MGPHTQTKQQLLCYCKVREDDYNVYVTNLHPFTHTLYPFPFHAAPPSVGVAPSVPLLSVGDPLTLTCMGKGCMTAFNFTWLFEGSPVNDSLVTVIDSTTSQLSVTSVTSSDFGKYTCQVTNVYGIGTAEVSVRDAGKCPGLRGEERVRSSLK